MNLKETIIAKKNLSESRFKKLYSDLYDELIDKTSFLLPDATFSERKKAIIFNATECPKCQICGKLIHFDVNEYGVIRFCSKKCRYTNHSIERKKYFHNMSIEEKNDWIKNQEQKRYEKTGYRTTFENPKVKEKVKQTLHGKYNVDNPYQIKEVIDSNRKAWQSKKEVIISKIKSTHAKLNKDEINEKKKQTSLKKYNVDNYSKTSEFRNKYKSKEFVERITTKIYNTKKTNQTLYQNIKDKIIESSLNTRNQHIKENPEYLQNIQEKAYNTKQSNKSFNTSKAEIEIYNLLLEKFGFDNVEWQYRSEEYPFNCDFYIKSLNLYIEYQGNWTHGSEPFDSNNPKHIEILNSWKKKSEEINFQGKNKQFYNNAINVWTISDPNKRKFAKNNNLNWIEFFNMKAFMEWYND